MFCQNCGNQVPDGSPFCPQCGAPAGGAPAQVQPQPQQAAPMNQVPAQYNPQAYAANAGDQGYKTLGLVGMICGIASLILIWFPVIGMFGFILGLVGLVLSGMSMSKAKGRPNGMGVAGLVCSIIAVVIGLPMCICTMGAAGSIGALGSVL